MTTSQPSHEFLSETFSRTVVDDAVRSRQREGWKLTHRRDNDDGKSTLVTFQRPMAVRPPPPEPMNKKAYERCLLVLDSSEEAYYAFQNLRDLVESNDVKNVRQIKRAVSHIEAWLSDFTKAMQGLDEEDS